MKLMKGQGNEWAARVLFYEGVFPTKNSKRKTEWAPGQTAFLATQPQFVGPDKSHCH
jgi:hypothetical protein